MPAYVVGVSGKPYPMKAGTEKGTGSPGASAERRRPSGLGSFAV